MISTQVLFSGIICGVIFFHTSIVAQLVFKKLGTESIRALLRALFPKFFALISVLALVNWILAWLSNSPCIAGTLHAISFILALKAFLLIKPTNQATDDGNTKKFKLLHKVSVLSTLVILALNIAMPFLVIN